MKRHTLWLGGLLMLAAGHHAAAYDLVDAWQAARHYNSDYAAARAELAAGAEQQVQGRSQLLPQVALAANYSSTTLSTPAGLAPYESSGYGIQLSQPLLDSSKYSAYQKGLIGSQLASINFDAAEQQLIVDIARAYFAALLAQDTLKATRASKQAYQTQLEQAKAAFALGSATVVDTHEAQAGYDAATAREIVAENQLEISQHDLQRLTGLDAQGMQALGEQQPLPPPASLQSWQELARSHSLQLQAAEQALALARQTVQEKRGNRLPVIALTAGYSEARSRAPETLPLTRGSSVGINISLPLYAGGGIDSQIREALAREEAASDKLESTRRQLLEDVRRGWLGVSNGAALVQAQQQLLRSARSRLESTRLGKEVGVRNNLEVLQAEQAYYDAITSLASARYDYLNARLQLGQLAGVLDAGLLQQVNAALLH